MPQVDSYAPPLHSRFFRAAFKPVFQGLFHLLSRIELHGFEHVPLRQPYLAVFNHVSTFDPPFMMTFWPEMIEVLGASDIWKRSGFGQNILARLYGAIPLHRFEYDRVALETVGRVLRAGYPLIISPEGGRTHTLAMRQARPGIAFIAELNDVPIVPVGIIGTHDGFFREAISGKRPPLTMRVGEPFRLPPVTGKGEARRQARQENADLVMRRIARLLPREYHGYYAS